MSTPNEGFFFVRHPKYDSFALIQVRGEIPEDIPKEVLHLMPGNHSGAHDDGVALEQDAKYLESQVMTGCPEWFTKLKHEPWIQAGNLTYRRVGAYLMM
jgi:hypothetical protein